MSSLKTSGLSLLKLSSGSPDWSVPDKDPRLHRKKDNSPVSSTGLDADGIVLLLPLDADDTPLLPRGLFSDLAAVAR